MVLKAFRGGKLRKAFLIYGRGENGIARATASNLFVIQEIVSGSPITAV